MRKTEFSIAYKSPLEKYKYFQFIFKYGVWVYLKISEIQFWINSLLKEKNEDEHV
jgi:hypothetical protein